MHGFPGENVHFVSNMKKIYKPMVCVPKVCVFIHRFVKHIQQILLEHHRFIDLLCCNEWRLKATFHIQSCTNNIL